MFEDQVEKTKNLTLGILEPGPVLVTLFLVVVANAVWSVIGPALVAVLSALVQCGITTRLVLLGLFFAGSFGLFALRTVNQVWYGHLACVVALTTAWNMIARLAVRIDPTERTGPRGGRLCARAGVGEYSERTGQARRQLIRNQRRRHG